MNVICDTSVIINFIKVESLHLLHLHPYAFWVTDHIDQEVSLLYPEQRSLLEIAFEQGCLGKVSITDLRELHIYSEMYKNEQLGSGECAAIAVAIHRGYLLAMDDNQAIRRTHSTSPLTKILRTPDIVVNLIQKGLLTVEDADSLLQAWTSRHRFKLPIHSFRQLVEPVHSR